MRVYHGSYIEIAKPDIIHSRKKVDFGVGFYVTPIEEQAKNWCRQYILRNKPGIVSIYNFDERAYGKCPSIQYESYSEEWLDFVFECRRGQDKSEYEIVAGGVANDRVFDTVELYLEGIISKRDAIGRLAFERPNFQICLRTQNVIDEYLVFERSYSV